jgi:pimeloyl-ACP methyl ester carboxylesterase
VESFVFSLVKSRLDFGGSIEMELEHNYIETNGIKLHVVQAGPKSGVPVVLLHGFPEFWYGWRKQIPALVEAGCRVIVPDQRGYNLSDKPKGIKSYDIYTLTDDVIGLIDALGYQKVNLVGHDWGAIVAWMVADQYPERLHKLSIMNAPHPAVMKKFLLRDLKQMRRSWYVFSFQPPWIPEAVWMRNNFRDSGRSLQASGLPNSFTDEDVEKYKEAWSQPGAMKSTINWYRAAVQRMPPVPKDSRIKVPTLMIWGIKDTALTTHWVQHDAAEEVNHYLTDFIFDTVSQIAIK